MPANKTIMRHCRQNCLAISKLLTFASVEHHPKHNRIVLDGFEVNRDVAESHTAGIFIRDTACFHCDLMHRDS